MKTMQNVRQKSVAELCYDESFELSPVTLMHDDYEKKEYLQKQFLIYFLCNISPEAFKEFKNGLNEVYNRFIPLSFCIDDLRSKRYSDELELQKTKND